MTGATLPHGKNNRQHSGILATYLALIDDLLDPTHFAGFKTHLDTVRMMSGTCQYVLHDSTRSFSGALILFLDDVYLKPRFYVFSVLAIHFSSLLRSGWRRKMVFEKIIQRVWRESFTRACGAFAKKARVNNSRHILSGGLFLISTEWRQP
jgi:hypothetical protein